MNQYVVGHRGAAGLAPENTIKAFKIGCENNADVVECDIHLTKDGKLVVFHDGTLDRTTNGKGWVKDYTFAELRELNAGDGEKIPTLEEVIETVMDYKKKLIIEIKAEDEIIAKNLTNAFCTFLSEHTEIIPNIYVHSFWHHVVKEVKEKFPDVSTFVLMMIGLPPKEMLQFILDAKANGASIEQDYISPELVRLAHENNLELNAWLLNNENEFKRMKDLGVDGLITNFPDRFHL
ncbi:MAG TPA: glycerophosphodiester phosphodiesterase family protein [Candidatus Eisenbacteria bacterium]|nr:glycerophosphodiester phosphodiesterase family protein [Candidatus Eisenbacteria bacterium]